MASQTSPQGNGGRATWQERLGEHCRRSKITAPVYNVVSDRRGGRTAWSSTVTVSGRTFSARMWYDGTYLNNAKEDAAEVALGCLQAQSGQPITTGAIFAGQFH